MGCGVSELSPSLLGAGCVFLGVGGVFRGVAGLLSCCVVFVFENGLFVKTRCGDGGKTCKRMGCGSLE